MRIGNSQSSRVPTSIFQRWGKRVVRFSIALIILFAAAYVMRRIILIDLARLALNHAPDLVAQERADGVRIAFAEPPAAWIMPMKNQMNEIWAPIQANGVNYYMFAGPRNLLTSYSERSVPNSPYYQAWAGGYVIKRKDDVLPDDLESLAWQVTGLDQRSWLSAMGDPKPIADSSTTTRIGDIIIDGHNLELWHGTMKSHSDLSANPRGPLATLIGMPPHSTWPPGVEPFHDVTLDGYFACWADSKRQVSIVIYAVAANYAAQAARTTVSNQELINLMKSAKIVPVS